ncbi:GNAT family N-acetyltransferase [Neorhizobium alkalisoli]|uniref:GNAT family N-acetyltransferase n=1 Tax=Neorhizobium alkalisoli TaxID=528178 RepID=UPI001FE111F2|nr:GNAT family N-acetyltransferase [Neorhizobium alkalisoli]
MNLPSSHLAAEAPPVPLIRNASHGVRPMEAADLQAVGRLFNKAFRNRDEAPQQDLLDYLDRVFLKCPGYAPDNGSIVHEDHHGRIDSALLALPMPFLVCGRRITARLLCAFMADKKTGLAGAARLARAIRLSQPDLCFSDNASPVSADHWTTGGGFMLPVQSLEWRRTFQPFQAGFDRLREKLPAGSHLPLSMSLKAADFVARRFFEAFTPPEPAGVTSIEADFDDFFTCAATMTERFAIRPDWSRDDLLWLMDTAASNMSLGRLRCKRVFNAKGTTIGCYLFFGRPGRMAHVLNILCREGHEFDVVGHMFSDLSASGYSAAHGMAQPFLMNALMRQRQMNFRHRGYFCMVTRHQDIRAAATGNDIFVGGLASESWSRLLTDFA